MLASQKYSNLVGVACEPYGIHLHMPASQDKPLQHYHLKRPSFGGAFQSIGWILVLCKISKLFQPTIEQDKMSASSVITRKSVEVNRAAIMYCQI